MDRFDEVPFRKSLSMVSRVWIGRLIWSSVYAMLFIFVLPGPKNLLAAEEESLAVLPFKIHVTKPVEHLLRGFQETLTQALKKRRFPTVSTRDINRHPLASLPQFEMKHILKMGKDLKAARVISGSLTQIGERFSVDLKVVYVTVKKPPFFIFMTADTVDDLEEIARRIAVSIEYEITGVPQVEAVRVKGNQRIEKEAILAVVRTKAGSMLDYERLDKDLRDIYKMGFFKDVQIATEDGAKGKIVIFHVAEKSSIGRIVFQGNKKVKDEDLKEELGIKLYSILDDSEVKQGANRLRDLYLQKGYYNVEIKTKIEPLPNNEVVLQYEIAENEKVYINKIQFIGNKEFDEDELKDIMETSEKGFFSWFTKSGYLDQKKLEFDSHKINAYYHNHGFIKAKVGETSIAHDREKGLIITIEVHEGPQYGIRNVRIEGDLIRPVEELMEKTQISGEKVFNRETVRKDVIALRGMYADEGYAFAEVKPIIDEDDQAFLIDITYNISKGNKVRFERINISGNTTSRDKVIRRELKVIEGEYYSGRGVKRSTQNLYRLGYFEDVEIQTKKGREDDMMILDVKVKEQSTGSFSLGAGYSSEDAAFGVFDIGEKNLFGHGLKLNLSAKIGGKSSEYDIRFVEPWLFDRPISAGVDLYNTEQEFDEYTKESLGGALKFGFPLNFLDEFTRGSVKYGYDDAEVTDILDTASTIIKDMEGRNLTSSMTFEVKRDSRDRFFNATKGSINSLSFEYAGGFLSGDVFFNRYRARSAWYFPFIWETVIMTQGRWGLVEQRSGGKLPVYQKFRLGGINSMRGFDYASISPTDPATGDRIGGERMMVYNFELRFPLLKEQGVIGVLFFDAGNVLTKDESYSFSGIRKSTGAGIRWYSPLGPLRLVYGKVLDPREGEKTGSFEFSVGGEF